MPKVVKYATCKSENTKIALEALRKCDVSLNAASRAYPLRKDT
jgi:hypothetical protein